MEHWGAGGVMLLAGGCVAGLVTGFWLFIDPAANGLMGRSLREVFHFLLHPIRMERIFYRHHRGFGLLIILASLTVLSVLRRYLGQHLEVRPQYGPGAPLHSWLWESLVFIVSFSSLFALLTGLVILVRPSLLKHFETLANRPVSGADLHRLWSRARSFWMGFFYHHPRLVGLILMAGAGFALLHLMPHW
ncbi:MAG: hypothetical protein HQL82_09875 [Magnetococcales bacterium]|nr:hypothetical protein [Magnetococcales bacterium]